MSQMINLPAPEIIQGSSIAMIIDAASSHHPKGERNKSELFINI